MAESTTQAISLPESAVKDVMTEALRRGTLQMLAQAIQEEAGGPDSSPIRAA